MGVDVSVIKTNVSSGYRRDMWTTSRNRAPGNDAVVAGCADKQWENLGIRLPNGLKANLVNAVHVRQRKPAFNFRGLLHRSEDK